MQFTHGGFGDAFEFLAEEIGAASIAFFGAEFLLGSLLEVSGLGGDEEGIKFGLQASGEKSEIGGEAQKAKEVEGFF